MAIKRVYADYIEFDNRYFVSGGSVSHTYTNVTSEERKSIYQYSGYPVYMWYNLYFRIPASSELAGATINSVKASPYFYQAMGLSGSYLRVGVSNNSHADTFQKELSNVGSTGRKEYDITDIFASDVTTKTSLWYLELGMVAPTGNSDEAQVYCNGAADSYKLYVDIDYTPPVTACGAPSNVDIDLATPPPGYPVTVSWNTGTAGTNNPIAGYSVRRSTSAAGTYTEIATTLPGVREYEDTSGDAGVSYYYKIVTLGSVTGYDSDLSGDTASCTSTATTACTPPTSISADPIAPLPGGQSTVTWNAGTNGTNNIITGYKLYRGSDPDGTFETLIGTYGSGTLSVVVNAPSSDGASYYYKVMAVGTYTGYDSSLSSVYATITATQSEAACSAPTSITVSDEHPEPSDLIDIAFSGAAAGVGNAITQHKLMSDTNENGSFATLVATLTTSATSGTFEDVICPATYGVRTYYRIQTIGTLSGYDSGLSAATSAITCLPADYTIEIPGEATLPSDIMYIVIYSDGTNVYAVDGDAVLDTVDMGTVLPAADVYNDGSDHWFLVTNYSEEAYVTADKARALTTVEQDYYVEYGTVISESITRQWTGSEWTTDISESAKSWVQSVFSEIIQNAYQISLKVGKGNIVSQINQTAEQIKIIARLISLEGIVTANEYFKILADGSMEAVNGKFSGTMQSGNWTFDENGMVYVNGSNYVKMVVVNGVAYYKTVGYEAEYGADYEKMANIRGYGVKVFSQSAGASVSFNKYSGSYNYEDICVFCDQAGSDSDSAAGNIGTSDKIWDLMWVRYIHYFTLHSESSREVKHDIADMKDFGETIDALNPVSFVYNNDSKERTRFGLIYEDTLSVLPEICLPKERDNDSVGIDYIALIPVLLKEIKTLRSRVLLLENNQDGSS